MQEKISQTHEFQEKLADLTEKLVFSHKNQIFI